MTEKCSNCLTNYIKCNKMDNFTLCWESYKKCVKECSDISTSEPALAVAQKKTRSCDMSRSAGAMSLSVVEERKFP